ncbi:MAG: aldolase/citrate lyase family protein [Ignisphaera sp.]|nr:aldolase/citrate lyase family protein [Ignisphaera sp.]MDW8085336.1 aldolase/citrate lyase family protein [Ignisphaera sp.]
MSLFKNRLKNGDVLLGTWVTFNCLDVVEVLSTLSFDWLVFDMEHAPLDVSDLQMLLAGVRGSSIVPMVRAPWNDMVVIKRILDVGASGLVIPWVNSREEAEAAIRYSSYPPTGVRGVGPRRAVMYGATEFLEYYRKFEREELIIAIQIETRKALENLEDIAGVKGIDIFYIGPMDLSVNLGIPLQYDHPKFMEAVEAVLRVAKKYDITPGIHTFSVEQAVKYMNMGFRFLALASDYRILRTTFSEMLEKVRGK